MPKIDFSNVALLDDDERAQFKNANEIMAGVREREHELGLTPYPKPSSAPPNLADMDLSDLPNNQLGQIYSQYTAHAQFLFGEVTRAEVAYKEGVSSLKLLDAKLKAKLYSKDTPKAEVPALVRDDALRIEYELEVLKLFAMREILGAHYKAYTKQAEALSRIITLRELDFNITIRDMGVQGRRKKAVVNKPGTVGFGVEEPSKGTKDR